MHWIRAFSTIAIVLGSLSGGIVQQPPTPPPYKGSRTEEYTGEGGEKVKIKSDVEVTFELVPKGTADTGIREIVCSNNCRGVPHHNEHSNCDAICDELCSDKHDRDSFVFVRYDLSDLWGAFLDCVTVAEVLVPKSPGRRIKEIGDVPSIKLHASHPSDEQVADAVWDAIQNLESIKVKMPREHFTNPCADTRRAWGTLEYELKVKCSSKAIVTIDGVESDKANTKTHEFSVNVSVPDPTRIVKEEASILCMCPKGTVTTPPPTLVREGPYDSPLRGPVQTSPQKAVEIGSKVFEWIGESLQKIQPRTNGDIEEEVEYYIPPGTEFVPESPSVQMMLCLVGVLIMFPPNGQPEVYELSEGGTPKPLQSIKSIRVACMEMQKKEPDGTRFKIGRVRDWRLQALANITNRSRFRGPADQARIWIYTDKATLKEVNERMLPGITEAAYLRVLHEVATAAEVDMSGPEYRKCLDPQLLLGLGAPFEAKLWLVRKLSALDAKGLVKFLKEKAGEFQSRITDEDSEKYAAELVDALAASPSRDVRRELAEFAAKAIPKFRMNAVFGHSKFVQASKG